MSEATTINFKVNGSAVEITAEEDVPLIYVLRNDLNLTGTRFGCGEGHCGACTVTIDGRATQSCTTPVSFASNRDVETIEALLGDPPHPIVASLQLHNAWQCGMIVRAAIPYLLCDLLLLVALIAVPALALWLPSIKLS